MRTKNAFLSALFLLIGQVLFAQVTGVVKDGDDFPVSGAEVTVMGSNASTVTSENGSFSIDAKVGDVLVIVDDMGTSQDFKVSKNNLGTLKLGSAVELTTVTLLGGIKMDAAQKVGAYDVVSREHFESTPYSSVDDVLNGRVAGLTFSSASGDPGSSNMVIIRGVSSLVGSPNPLYVIDGVVVGKGADNAAMMESWNPLSALDPNAIESVHVLKDASATALYGSRGANGVIIVKTKQGKFNQKTRFNFSSEMAIQDRAFEKMTLMNGDEYIKYGGMLMWNSQGGNGLPGSTTFSTLEDATNYFLNTYEPQYTAGDPFTDWTDAVTRNLAIVKTYSFSAAGGGENTSYRLGGSYYENKPWVRDAGFNRISLNSAIEHKASDKLRFSANVNYSNIDRDTYAGGRASANPVNSAIMLSPLRQIYNADGTYNQDLGNLGTNDYTPGFNPVGVQDGTIEKARINTVIGSITADWEFAKNLNFNSLYGAQYQWMKESQLVASYIPYFVLSIDDKGFYQDNRTQMLDWNWSNTVSYTNKFADKHDLQVYLGMEYQDHMYDQLSAFTYGMNEFKPYFRFTDEEIFVGNTDFRWTQISYFSRLNYSFENKYTFSGQFRRDGNSTLGSREKFGNFWSLGAAWNLHNEEFMSDAISTLTLRGSYGVLGNIPYADQWGGQWDALALLGYNNTNTWGGNTGIGAINNPGNSSLVWEESKHLDIGLDLGFFNNRLKLTLDYYDKMTDLAIFGVTPAVESGFLGDYNGNAATLSNKGFELSLDASIINNENFKWFLNLNGSFQETFVDKLYQDLVTFGSDDPGAGDNELVALAPGHLLGEYYTILYGGVDENGAAWYWTDGTKTETTTDKTLAEKAWFGKNAFPRYMAAISSDFSYKNVSLSFMFSGQFDFYVQNAVHSYTIHDGRFPTRNQITDALYDSWTTAPGMENTDASNPMATLGNLSESRLESSRFLKKGDHIRLKDLKIAYSFGDLFKSSTGLNNLSIYFRGTNLWTYAFDKDLNFDPESNSNSWSWIGKGRYWYSAPVLRTYSLGVQIDF
ncbi:SusC/RagA family TonB-linked outer membrane protein [Moheibacter sediminis]|uniref:TonB-linked outer membrane protein, SusC/RagA family n=1 Tax=Moheibacter sediminis TaxID=1434700 RepID=A0A1W2BD26_9FLAO|nr:SusC/RagA family TonB-linked outer membrane protein [Moheibacter sediminis]SMC70913.1 TonB-linked outer membrane protein, SusC/RagA family [Moheibacter sediminis]